MAESGPEAVDLFAGQAMQAILANPQAMEAVTRMGSQALTYDDALAAIATKSYDIAMAMVVERARRRRIEPEFKLGAPGRVARTGDRLDGKAR